MGDDGVVGVVLTVSGMHCGSCAANVEECLMESDGVRAARVDLEAATAQVEFDPGRISVNDLCALIADAGYEAGLTDDR